VPSAVKFEPIQWGVTPRLTVRHDCTVICKITTVIARPISGSAMSSPSDDHGASHNAQTHERIGAGVGTVRDQRRTIQALPGAEKAEG